ncbi:uncharacterized protein MONOS_2287 [Monocercomonoides exilis]|uniref:uncharacterized protein n=1 Tax=Monocercomonoides exilis TaxID=2049356 RepID=UPI00355AC8B3|nr:hypothetical protein MONOS_2287 [Monocercomonoides exilis]|eukprot:MONOS_2287.1-p1 / transcript=MONOS_2287.1 / gene=MONOS_2287 / organism=Monocercomonoides_exilis_PA203 / gene_product=unspecified product / transcript_product=unspecified product / location=Mono_scaffold00046:102368-102619(-) / protein_length=84 / sequence_SO=supercontig / SO=protein_coding / is_pseudo=false
MEKELTKKTEEEKGNEESSILSKGDQLPSQQTQKEPEEEQKLSKADEASVEEATSKANTATQSEDIEIIDTSLKTSKRSSTYS